MIARDLIDQLATMRAHPLTETNVNAVFMQSGYLIFDARDPDEDKIAELTEELDAANAAAKEAEDEAEGLTAELDRVSDAEWNAADMADDVGRIRQQALTWAKRIEEVERELTALRKRKGIGPGYYANAREVLDYLQASPDPKARSLVDKIRGCV